VEIIQSPLDQAVAINAKFPKLLSIKARKGRISQRAIYMQKDIQFILFGFLNNGAMFNWKMYFRWPSKVNTQQKIDHKVTK
jgi:hypothetical protein